MCPHLNTETGCTLGDEKPFACKLWPLRIMEYCGKRYVTLSTRCYAYSDEFAKNSEQLLKEGLLEILQNEVKKDPSLVLEYHPSYRLLCTLDEGEKYVNSVLYFHTAEAGDAQRIADTVSNHGTNICQYSAGFLIALAGKYDTRICFDNDTLYVYLPGHSTSAHAAYLMPVGYNIDIKQSLELLVCHAASLGKKPMIWGALSNDLKAVCENGYRYHLYDERDWWDYIYSVRDLASLPGKTFHKKRTALNKFKRDFDNCYSYHVIDKNNIERVRRYQNKWLTARFENYGMDESLLAENEQIDFLLDNFNSLSVKGGYVEINGKVAGYTLAVPLGADSYDMTTLKTSRKYPNVTVYLINEFAKVLEHRASYINFEEDIGSEGLRKFKNDFNPCALLKKSRIEFE